MSLDLAVIEDLELVLGAEIVADLISTFDGDSASLATQIRDAHAACDPTKVARAAHTLRSTSDTFGARTLASICADLEYRGRAGELVKAETIDHFMAEVDRVRTGLRARFVR